MKARIVNIQKFSLHDGPGIRTLVFFKGCPLNCLWCSNPECINPQPEIGFNRAKCNGCGKCADVCPSRAINLDIDKLPVINRHLCTACEACVEVCSPQALAVYGKEINLEELYKEIQSDIIFYNDLGGVTASGGEPLLQIDFVEALFRICKESRITTAIETCGNVNSNTMQRILPHVDFIFYDLKSIDEQQHLKLTGRSNRLILENARLVVASGVQVQFRLPLIPGFNDSLENIKTTADFLRGLNTKNAFSIELMPYHRLGIGKYEALNREYLLKGMDMAGTEVIELARLRFQEFGIRCLVSR